MTTVSYINLHEYYFITAWLDFAKHYSHSQHLRGSWQKPYRVYMPGEQLLLRQCILKHRQNYPLTPPKAGPHLVPWEEEAGERRGSPEHTHSPHSCAGPQTPQALKPGASGRSQKSSVLGISLTCQARQGTIEKQKEINTSSQLLTRKRQQYGNSVF